MKLSKLPYVVRGFGAFLIAGALALALEAAMMKIVSSSPRANIGFTATMVIMAIPGAVGGALFALGTQAAWRAAFGFAGGLSFAWAASMFVLISIQGGGRPEYVWLGAGCAVAFGIGGAIGGATLGCRNALTGAVAFAIAGALYGVGVGLSSVGEMPHLLMLAMIVGAYAVGGGLLGLAIDMQRRR